MLLVVQVCEDGLVTNLVTNIEHKVEWEFLGKGFKQQLYKLDLTENLIKEIFTFLS